MWKPNKNGRYLHNGTITDIACAGTRVERTTGNISVLEPIWDGPWSLLSPDWQGGVPTVEQLKRWQWWAVMHDNENLYCGKAKMSVAYFYIGNAVIDREFIGKSAPVQPDLTNGPLWVPLEVCK